MQDCLALSPEEMEKIIEIRLDAIDRETAKTSTNVEAMRGEVFELAKQVSRLEGTISGPSKPWWVNSIVAPLMVIALTAIATDLISLHIKVSRIGDYLHDNGGFIAGLRLEKVGPGKAQEAERIVAEAKQAKVKIPSDVIERTGNKFVDAPNAPQAWNAALQLAAYQRSLNADTMAPLQNLRPLSESFRPVILLRIEQASGPNSQLPAQVLLAGYAPPESAATIEPFTGQFIQPPQVNSGASFIILDWKRSDVSFVLANIHLKSVIIRNAKVRYTATPLWLENVYFVNCTFDIIPEQSRAVDFAKALLSPSAVTFRE